LSAQVTPPVQDSDELNPVFHRAVEQQVLSGKLRSDLASSSRGCPRPGNSDSNCSLSLIEQATSGRVVVPPDVKQDVDKI